MTPRPSLPSHAFRSVPPAGAVRLLLGALLACVLGGSGTAQFGTVAAHQKINDRAGNFGGILDFFDLFGTDVCALGDLDGDGVVDLAVGAEGDDDGGSAAGAVWILFLNSSGRVRDWQKISRTMGGFGTGLQGGDVFGTAVAALGDLDGDGLPDLAVGATGDDDGGTDRGAVWILFLNADGTVKGKQKISSTSGGFGGVLDTRDIFGSSLARIGDLDGDGVTELAVGARFTDDGAFATGAVWILFLNADGTIHGEQKISPLAGGLVGPLPASSYFGSAVGGLGDFDHDGIPDLAVGALGIQSGRGAIWLLFLNADGTVKGERMIGPGTGGFGGALDPNDSFGFAVTSLGDLDADGTTDVAVGALLDDDGGLDQGAIWILYLEPDGTVRREQKISETTGGFQGNLLPEDNFGRGVTLIGDLDGNGLPDLAVGAREDGNNDYGAVWILFLEPCFTLDFETEDDFSTPLVNGQHIDTEFGEFVACSSFGPNAGLGIFDSTVGGPNDPSQDRDLLVDRGNLLVLQTENFPPDANDVFPRPNDDENGGTMRFDFRLPVELHSVRLIDLDGGDGTTTLILRDGPGRTRVYTVPTDWTGDLLLGQPGQGVLDLTTLAPQPGFGSVATALESAGFDARDVVVLEVFLDGSGALDDLSLCPIVPRSSATMRDGSGTNPRNLRASAAPVLGETWSAVLDCTGSAPGLAVIEVRTAARSGMPSPSGEILIGGTLLYRSVGTSVAPHRLAWNLPRDLALCGLEFHVQGLCQELTSSPLQPRLRSRRACLSNALDVVIGW